MAKIARRKPFPPLAYIIGITLLLILSISLKSRLFNILSFPLRVSSAFITDAAALLDYRFILNENLRLKKEVLKIRKDTVLIEELRRENERLKGLLSFKEQSPYVAIAARVIARDPNNWSRGIVINQGSKQGIRQGNAVITEAGLVGRVMEATPAASKIILINDLDNAVSALIQRTRDEGLITGALLGGLVMRYLEKDCDVKAGDIVLTSGLTKNYPAAILIGEVKEVREELQGLGRYCVIKPAVDLMKVEEVLVIVRQ